jgi:signal transduction histidine kinase
MTFTGRIRLYLFAVALLPPVALLGVVYWQSTARSEQINRQLAADNIRRADIVLQAIRNNTSKSLEALAGSPSLRSAVRRLSRNTQQNIEIDIAASPLDFAEILNGDGLVLASSHRPGLIGERLPAPGLQTVSPTVEFDRTGRHASFSRVVPLAHNMALYGGTYIDTALMSQLSVVSAAQVDLLFVEDSAGVSKRSALMTPLDLYAHDSTFEAVLEGGSQAGYFITAVIHPVSREPLIMSVLQTTAFVTAASVILALILGLYIAGKAKREIDNLVMATTRVAGGDFGTPVMAYEEGEFAQLADSFSEMMVRLNDSQKKLAASETIAAWQMVGRKIAHEVKNPLTPISISADDIRRSYAEDLPDFENTLTTNCNMINSEIVRLSRLLDEFVGFARMQPPNKSVTAMGQILDEIRPLYTSELQHGALTIEDVSNRKGVMIDPEQVKQVIINLTKNALESQEDAHVHLRVSDSGDFITIEVTDDGPGFPDEILNTGAQPLVSQKPGGSGLGLVICQRIAIDHGGAMDIANQSEGGARVAIRIPVK